MAEPLRFRVHTIGFGGLRDHEPSPSGIVLEIEWLADPISVKRVPLLRDDYEISGSALIAAMQSQDVYWLNLDGPDSSPLTGLFNAVRDGQTHCP